MIPYDITLSFFLYTQRLHRETITSSVFYQMAHTHYDLARTSIRFSTMRPKHVVENQDIATLPRKRHHLALINRANVIERCLIDFSSVAEKSVTRLISGS